MIPCDLRYPAAAQLIRTAVADVDELRLLSGDDPADKRCSHTLVVRFKAGILVNDAVCVRTAFKQNLFVVLCKILRRDQSVVYAAGKLLAGEPARKIARLSAAHAVANDCDDAFAATAIFDYIAVLIFGSYLSLVGDTKAFHIFPSAFCIFLRS